MGNAMQHITSFSGLYQHSHRPTDECVQQVEHHITLPKQKITLHLSIEIRHMSTSSYWAVPWSGPTLTHRTSVDDGRYHVQHCH
eukprot:6467739-Amphidinium_carterae.1